jgi:CHASE2 domain-containing sensor protein
MLAEYLVLRVYCSRRGRSLAQLGLAGYLLSGALLLMALRVALTGGWWGWIAALLGGAFLVHLLDLRARLGSTVAPG